MFEGNEMQSLEFDKEMSPNVKNEIDSMIDLFLGEFMLEEYKGEQHIVAREHYNKIFHELLPKYLRLSALFSPEPSPPSRAGEVFE